MTQTLYKSDFQEFVTSGTSCQHFIGTGNPNAKVLIIGKESAILDTDVIGKEWYDRNAQDWQNHISNGTGEILEYDVDVTHPLRKGWGKNTWSKYQQLSKHIFSESEKHYYIDFLKNCFTTEINDAPSKYTATAKKDGLNIRKQLFKDSAYIQQFPVVVLACSNYITNNGKVREIDEIFRVSYEGDESGKYYYNKSNWFYLHYNADRSKLVIHTRQLSADVKAELLSDMGKIVSDHLYKFKTQG